MTIPEKNAPLTEKEITQAADTFFPLFDIILSRMPEGSKIEDTLKVMENVARLAQKNRADDREKEIKEKFGFNKPTEEDDDA
tara:strand:+ start:2433 stop:2678 length:246 start_codon:yes stop_codon:yes gene_type:complete